MTKSWAINQARRKETVYFLFSLCLIKAEKAELSFIIT